MQHLRVQPKAHESQRDADLKQSSTLPWDPTGSTWVVPKKEGFLLGIPTYKVAQYNLYLKGAHNVENNPRR